jgi:flavin reductase (DIM6/NTAB) family NADH-FMN oxidoreductase RutF
MFYEVQGRRHGLPHDPFKGCVVPRPIGWVTTVDGRGRVNLAPFSFFNAVAADPPMVMYCTNGGHLEGMLKDSLHNVREVGEFVINVATWDLRDRMNVTSANLARDVDELALAGLTATPSKLVRPPRVKESPVHLECELHQIIELPHGSKEYPNNMILGRVLGIHIDESVLTDGLVDIRKLKPIARLGYTEYAVVHDTFTMSRPVVPAAG